MLSKKWYSVFICEKNMAKIENKIKFLDLFAGCGGLSEGFIQAGYEPVAHVEMDKSACFSLKTRMSYHWLKKHHNLNIYKDYLNNKISREEFYTHIPEKVINSVINVEISESTENSIFQKIDNLLGKENLDLIIGGPPCQAYSLIGRASKSDKMVGDKRNYLFIYYADFIARYRPKYFVFENVSGLLSAKDRNGVKYFDMMKSKFEDLGYTVNTQLLNSFDYGVPQARKRLILIGSRNDCITNFPEPDKLDLPIKINDIFNDLPKLHNGENYTPFLSKVDASSFLYKLNIKDDDMPITYHKARKNNKQDLEIYKIVVKQWNAKKIRIDYNCLPESLKTHRNRTSFVDRFKVVAGDLPYSHTVVAHLSKDGHYYIHPDIQQNRSITPREAARLQTFPDNYCFETASGQLSLATAFRQIGNAVPVFLAYKIALKMKGYFS